jgi:cyanate permease
MNTGSALAAIVSPPVFGYIVDQTGDWHLPFIGSIVLLLVGTGLSFTMRPDRKFVDALEVPEVALPVAQVTSGKPQ